MPNEEIIYGSIVTDIGAAKIAKAANKGEKVDLKYLAAGDGNGEAYEPSTDQTELKNLCWQGDITSYEVSPDDDKQLIIKGQISSETGFFTMRELGLLDSDGDLIAITNTGNIDIIPYSSGEILKLDITFYIQFKSAQIGSVNIVVRPTAEDELREEFRNEIESLKSSFYEADKADIENVFNMSGSGSGGYPLEWEEVSETDIDALFN